MSESGAERDPLALSSSGQGADSKTEQAEAAALFGESVAIMARLRGPGGCPWDREQTFDSIRKYTVEETYEVLDAIERKHWTDLAEELGDLLLQVLFYARMAEDEGIFSIVDVLGHLNRKLVRRHPHVFGEAAAAIAGNRAAVDAAGTTESVQVLRNWEAIKAAEKLAQPEEQDGRASLLDAVPRNFPALLEAGKLGSRAAKVGFDWPDVRGLLDKVEEECTELRAELDADGSAPSTAAEEELGDLLFTVVNLARHLRIDPETALKRTTRKFRRRFSAMEEAAARPLAEHSAAEWEALWSAAKGREIARGQAGAAADQNEAAPADIVPGAATT